LGAAWQTVANGGLMPSSCLGVQRGFGETGRFLKRLQEYFVPAMPQ
jgi:hypothetical protein